MYYDSLPLIAGILSACLFTSYMGKCWFFLNLQICRSDITIIFPIYFNIIHHIPSVLTGLDTPFKNQNFATFYHDLESSPKLIPRWIQVILHVFTTEFYYSELNFWKTPVISSVISPVISYCHRGIDFRGIFSLHPSISHKIPLFGPIYTPIK